MGQRGSGMEQRAITCDRPSVALKNTPVISIGCGLLGWLSARHGHVRRVAAVDFPCIFRSRAAYPMARKGEYSCAQ